jgi:hypothetical protein
MTSVVEYYPDAIVMKSRGVLEYLTFGNWGRICTIDLSRKVVEETRIRFRRNVTTTRPTHDFDAVDYSFKLVKRMVRKGVEYDVEEFRVGLRFAATTDILPLAVFRGTTDSPVGLGALIAKLLPDSWMSQDITHEIASRSLANMLCQKLNLKLAM